MKRISCIITALLVSATLALTNSADAKGGSGGSGGRGGFGGAGSNKGGSGSNKGGWAGSNKGGSGSNKGGWAGSNKGGSGLNKGGWAGSKGGSGTTSGQIKIKIKIHHSLVKRYGGGFIPEDPDTAKYGVELLEIYRGTAADEGLRPSDVIVSFDGMATSTRDHLYAAVEQAGREAEVVYLNGESGEYCRVTLYPRNGLIGVLPGESVRIE